MTTVAATAHGAHAHHDDRPFIRKYIFSTDHKIIGIQFLFVSLFFLLVGGLLAMQMRWQLGFPGKPMPGGGILPETMAPGGVILPEYYIQLVTMHGTFMVFFAIMRSEEHTSELQSRLHLVCRLLLEKKKKIKRQSSTIDDLVEEILIS